MSNRYKAGLITEMKLLLKQIDKDYKTKSELYRGDSFQCLVNNTVDALRIALIIKTAIRGMNPNELGAGTKKATAKKKSMLYPIWLFDARIAIGIGKVDLEMKRITTSNGAAFELSGRLLDELKNTRTRFGIATKDLYHAELHTAAILLDAIVTKTSALQCKVIEMKLQGHTETEIAGEFKIMQSAVNQRSVSGNWNAILVFVQRFEKIYGHD